MDIEFPNGQVVTDIPDGMTQEQILAQLQKDGYDTKALLQPAGQPAAPAEPSMLETAGRVAKNVLGPAANAISTGIIEPTLGLGQTVAHLFPEVGGINLGRGMDRNVDAYMEAKKSVVPDTAASIVGGVLGYGLGAMLPMGKTNTAMKVGEQMAKQGAMGMGFGAAQPLEGVVDDEDFTKKKNLQMLIGGVGGVAFDRAFAGLSWGAKRALALMPAAQMQAFRNQLSRLAGPDRQRAIEALENAPEIVAGSKPTASQALAETPGAAGLASLEKSIKSMPEYSGMFKERSAKQVDARMAELFKISKSPEERRALLEAKKLIGEKDREQALYAIEAANLYRRTGDVPLRAGALAKELRQMAAKSPDNDVKAMLQYFASDIMDSVPPHEMNGLIPGSVVYESFIKPMRKKAAALINEKGNPYGGGLSQNMEKAILDARAKLNEAMDKSSGGLWKRYMQDYAEASAKVNRTDVGQGLQAAYKNSLDNETHGVFARAVDQGAEAFMKKATGLKKTDLADVLKPDEIASVNKVLADITRAEKAQKLGRGIDKPEGASKDVKNTFPHILSRLMVIASAGERFMMKEGQSKINTKAAELFLNPQELAKFIKQVPYSEMGPVTKAMMQFMSDEQRSQFTRLVANMGTTEVLTGQ